MSEGIIFDIQRSSTVDGPGIRTTVFFKGCNLSCKWCHNPESQAAAPQMLFYADKCTGCGKCREVCPHGLQSCELCGKCEWYCPQNARKVCGKTMTAEDVISTVKKDKPFYDASGGGLTCSGGECMLQLDFLADILRLAKEAEIHTAVDTAGNLPWSSFEKILPYADMFLYDFKAFSRELHKEGTGVYPELIRENLARLASLGKDILIRIPLIPGYNDSDEELNGMAGFLKEHDIRHVEVLPYHQLGEHKYASIGREFTPYRVPSKEELEHAKAFFN